MARAISLLSLMQLLRSHRRPITALELARKLDVSVRSIYRDIGALQTEGAAIEGEAGTGYRLRQGLSLPPLLFLPAELDALARGARWVVEHGDAALTGAAAGALSKIINVRPAAVAPGEAISIPRRWDGEAKDPAVLRRALRERRKLSLHYGGAKGSGTAHVVWPIALGSFEDARVLAAWCEMQRDFRHFRLDRMSGCVVQRNRYPAERTGLIKDWVSSLEIDAGAF